MHVVVVGCGRVGSGLARTLEESGRTGEKSVHTEKDKPAEKAAEKPPEKPPEKPVEKPSQDRPDRA